MFVLLNRYIVVDSKKNGHGRRKGNKRKIHLDVCSPRRFSIDGASGANQESSSRARHEKKKKKKKERSLGYIFVLPLSFKLNFNTRKRKRALVQREEKRKKEDPGIKKRR